MAVHIAPAPKSQLPGQYLSAPKTDPFKGVTVAPPTDYYGMSDLQMREEFRRWIPLNLYPPSDFLRSIEQAKKWRYGEFAKGATAGIQQASPLYHDGFGVLNRYTGIELFGKISSFLSGEEPNIPAYLEPPSPEGIFGALGKGKVRGAAGQLAYSTGNALATSSPGIAAGLAGGTAGAQLGASFAGPKGAAVGAMAGSAISAFGFSLAANTGELHRSLISNPDIVNNLPPERIDKIAFWGGVAMALIDTAVFSHIFAGVTKTAFKNMKGVVANEIVKRGLKSGLEEGSAEGIQATIAESIEQGFSGRPDIAQGLMRVLDEALVGGIMGAGGGTIGTSIVGGRSEASVNAWTHNELIKAKPLRRAIIEFGLGETDNQGRIKINSFQPAFNMWAKGDLDAVGRVSLEETLAGFSEVINRSLGPKGRVNLGVVPISGFQIPGNQTLYSATHDVYLLLDGEGNLYLDAGLDIQARKARSTREIRRRAGNLSETPTVEEAIQYLARGYGITTEEVLDRWGYSDQNDYVDLAKKHAFSEPEFTINPEDIEALDNPFLLGNFRDVSTGQQMMQAAAEGAMVDQAAAAEMTEFRNNSAELASLLHGDPNYPMFLNRTEQLQPRASPFAKHATGARGSLQYEGGGTDFIRMLDPSLDDRSIFRDLNDHILDVIPTYRLNDLEGPIGPNTKAYVKFKVDSDNTLIPIGPDTNAAGEIITHEFPFQLGKIRRKSFFKGVQVGDEVWVELKPGTTEAKVKDTLYRDDGVSKQYGRPLVSLDHVTGPTEILKNPTENQLRRFAKKVQRAHRENRFGMIRWLRDVDGNFYFADGTEQIHEYIADDIIRLDGTEKQRTSGYSGFQNDKFFNSKTGYVNVFAYGGFSSDAEALESSIRDVKNDGAFPVPAKWTPVRMLSDASVADLLIAEGRGKDIQAQTWAYEMMASAPSILRSDSALNEESNFAKSYLHEIANTNNPVDLIEAGGFKLLADKFRADPKVRRRVQEIMDVWSKKVLNEPIAPDQQSRLDARYYNEIHDVITSGADRLGIKPNEYARRIWLGMQKIASDESGDVQTGFTHEDRLEMEFNRKLRWINMQASFNPRNEADQFTRKMPPLSPSQFKNMIDKGHANLLSVAISVGASNIMAYLLLRAIEEEEDQRG